MFKKSKIIVGAALLAVSVLSFTLPQQAEAINLGSIAGKAVGAAKEQQEINKALNYYDNEGRHELFDRPASQPRQVGDGGVITRRTA